MQSIGYRHAGELRPHGYTRHHVHMLSLHIIRRSGGGERIPAMQLVRRAASCKAVAKGGSCSRRSYRSLTFHNESMFCQVSCFIMAVSVVPGVPGLDDNAGVRDRR